MSNPSRFLDFIHFIRKLCKTTIRVDTCKLHLLGRYILLKLDVSWNVLVNQALVVRFQGLHIRLGHALGVQIEFAVITVNTL